MYFTIFVVNTALEIKVMFWIWPANTGLMHLVYSDILKEREKPSKSYESIQLQCDQCSHGPTNLQKRSYMLEG
jgi:hypothetical protein